ncbi:hypothetical protein F2Q68_00025105 [Brassica cretica]|uniref:Uncharacterized protein n=2 Tax=Brassica cretica TaxID=69181 RepID=A0ABQ7DJR1_BRACR|nr:hypothetical protein F2Q68_00025105 [Brassica cretica]KAF3578227.1 hypothetical protein DY000_02030558 [Brassica cretica]
MTSLTGAEHDGGAEHCGEETTCTRDLVLGGITAWNEQRISGPATWEEEAARGLEQARSQGTVHSGLTTRADEVGVKPLWSWRSSERFGGAGCQGRSEKTNT